MVKINEVNDLLYYKRYAYVLFILIIPLIIISQQHLPYLHYAFLIFSDRRLPQKSYYNFRIISKMDQPWFNESFWFQS